MNSAMTKEEQELWQKVYAAAFVSNFNQNYVLYRQFDDAAKATNADWPSSVADLAVFRLRQWRENEEPDVGKTINIPETFKE